LFVSIACSQLFQESWILDNYDVSVVEITLSAEKSRVGASFCKDGEETSNFGFEKTTISGVICRNRAFYVLYSRLLSFVAASNNFSNINTVLGARV
jgi:hypothetical protein